MSKLIVNLTEKVAEQEIDKQLQDVPEPVLQRINTPFDLHQSLVMYVLKRLPNQYMVVEDQNLPDSEYEEFEATAEDRSQIAHLISRGFIVSYQNLTRRRMLRLPRQPPSARQPVILHQTGLGNGWKPFSISLTNRG
jgi:hypothetical protein